MTTVIKTFEANRTSCSIEQPKPKYWTLAEYQRAIKCGALGQEEHLELIRGEIIEKMPHNERHAWALSCLHETISKALGVVGSFYVRVQMPIVLPHDSQPEPDLVVIRGSARENRNHPGPENAILVVEVADTSIYYDLNNKASLYAMDAVQDYWVMIVPTRELRVHRDPSSAVIDAPAFYRSIGTYTEDMEVGLLAEPAIRFMVADLLPPVSETAENGNM